MITIYLDNDKITHIFSTTGTTILFPHPTILILTKRPKKHTISRNIQKNKFYIEKYNYLNKKAMELELTLGNYYIECSKIERENSSDFGDNLYYFYKIDLYNQFNDTSEINLDTTNIKEIPAKFFYDFEIKCSRSEESEQIERKLNNFICTKKFENPKAFDIYKYMNKEKDNNFLLMSKRHYIRFSDYFFTFYLKLSYGQQQKMLMEL